MRPIGIYGVHALNLIPIHECAFNYLFSRFTGVFIHKS